MTLLPRRMERSEAGAKGDDMESLGPGDHPGGHGVNYDFEQADKGSLGFVGVDRVKELKRDVRMSLGRCCQSPRSRHSSGTTCGSTIPIYGLYNKTASGY